MIRIKEIRKRKGYNQKEVSEAIGITQSQYSRYESGATNIPGDMLPKIADFLGVTVDELLGRSSTSEAPGWKEVNPADFSVKHPTEPLPDLFNTVKIPILGSVRAGFDWLAQQEIVGYIDVEESLATRFPDVFALYVKGDSMEPEIRHNDIAICVPRSQVDNGSIAIICINGDEGTIKRVRTDHDGITIIPSNPAYPSRHYTPEEVVNIPITIQALVIEIRRRYAM